MGAHLRVSRSVSILTASRRDCRNYMSDSLVYRQIWRVYCLHADNVITAVNVMNLACDSACHLADQVEGGFRNLILRNVASQRRIVIHSILGYNGNPLCPLQRAS